MDWRKKKRRRVGGSPQRDHGSERKGGGMKEEPGTKRKVMTIKRTEQIKEEREKKLEIQHQEAKRTILIDDDDCMSW
jgi:hypothetical protein